MTGFGSALVGLLVPGGPPGGRRRPRCRGAVPKFGLAYAGVAGALAVGQLLIEIYRGQQFHHPSRRRGHRGRAGADQQRRGRRGLGPGRRRAGAGRRWPAMCAVARLGPHGHGGRRCAGPGPVGPGRRRRPARRRRPCSAWRCRPPTSPISWSPIPSTGLETVVTSEGPQALLERPGLALLGGPAARRRGRALLGRRAVAAAAAGHRRRAARASPSPCSPPR